jgi:hypothetical protein
VAEPVHVRRLTDQEGQKLQQIVRRGSTNSVRCRRAMMLLASAGGNWVPVIAQLVQADEDTVRDVIHRFNEIGLACLDPRWAGGRPRQLSSDRGLRHPDGHHLPHQTRPALHSLVTARTRRLPTENPRPGDLHRPRGVTRPARPPRCHLSAHQDMEGIPGPRARRSWTGSRRSLTASRNGSSPSTSSAPSGSDPPAAAAGPRSQARPGAGHLPPHPRSAVLPRLLLGRQRHLVGRQPPQEGGRQHAGRTEVDPRRPTRRRSDPRDPGQPVRPQRRRHPPLGSKPTSDHCGSSPSPTRTTPTTPCRQGHCTPTCGGATPTPVTRAS